MSKETSGVFDYKVVATVKDRTFTSAFRNAAYKALMGTEGVSNQIGNKLSASDISDGVDLKVRLLDGVAFVAGSTYRLFDEGSGNNKDLAIDSEQVGLNRIDLVVLEFSSLDVDRVVIAKIIKGLPGVAPFPPSLITSNVEDAKGIYQIALHQVIITGGNQNAVVVTDVRPFYNDLRSTFVNIAGIISGAIVVGEADLAAFADLAALANEAEADENGRNIAGNLKINTYNLLADIGLLDSDFTALSLNAGWLLIKNAMPDNSRFIFQAESGGVNPIAESVLSPLTGSWVFDIYKKVSLSSVILGSDQGANEKYFSTITSVFKGWKIVLNEFSKAGDSEKLDGIDSVGYAKRETASYIGLSIPTGWRRIVKFTDALNGRGAWEITIRGAFTGESAILHVFTTNLVGGVLKEDIINVISSNFRSILSAVRLRYEVGETAKYLEINKLTTGDQGIIITVKPITDVTIDTRNPYIMIDPFIIAGGGGTLISAELDLLETLLNIEEIFIVTKDGNSASGILLEDFGATGLTITTDRNSLNATVITNNWASKYTHLFLEVGEDDDETRIIEIQTSINIVSLTRITTNKEEDSLIIDRKTARFTVAAATELKGYYARRALWSGSASLPGSSTTGLVKVFKVWGGVR